MSDEHFLSRTRHFLSPLACGFRRCFGGRVSPPPSPAVQQRPPSPHSFPRLDIIRLNILPNTCPSSSTPQTGYLHVQQPISVQPTPRISPSASFQESTYQLPGSSVDHQAIHPAYSPLPHPQNQSAPPHRFNNTLEYVPILHQTSPGRTTVSRALSIEKLF
jgi:hypothetical protein